MPPPKLSGGVCLSVRPSVYPSVCPVPRLNSRTERRRKPKIGRMVVRHTSIPWTYLEVKRSKVKVTRLVNADIVNAQYHPYGKAYERQNWYTDGARRSPSATSPVTSGSKVKTARSHNASDRCWPISRERNVLETPKLAGRLSTPRAIMRTSFKVRGQRSRSSGRLMLT